ncbi:uncharacterized protein BDZ99DRAFT_468788 [Mytilinidion resinicola]|uniref:Uncharacterized protein n=1 Tax=Mytilinidion resinicola TaxID=574789 RepID=A0A6A6Y1Y5_9PEZI|nr:uncharacterized protein BDZ99DRAFT_468788 [Mytilinidion resinicola]KAF2802568.1 hypothetical protein BDZ99DRAFT_468788 [Mytilinidion resinicola]
MIWQINQQLRRKRENISVADYQTFGEELVSELWKGRMDWATALEHFFTFIGQHGRATQIGVTASAPPVPHAVQQPQQQQTSAPAPPTANNIERPKQDTMPSPPHATAIIDQERVAQREILKNRLEKVAGERPEAALQLAFRLEIKIYGESKHDLANYRRLIKYESVTETKFNKWYEEWMESDSGEDMDISGRR